MLVKGCSRIACLCHRIRREAETENNNKNSYRAGELAKSRLRVGCFALTREPDFRISVCWTDLVWLSETGAVFCTEQVQKGSDNANVGKTQ